MEFFKYQGTGNDFVMIDNRAGNVNLSVGQITRICNRKFGIGADGLILLQDHKELDFEMVYFNADGNESSMCGNGGRCIIQFAHDLKIIGKSCNFMAIDGLHDGVVKPNKVSLKMANVSTLESGVGYYYLDTGSPHYVEIVKDVKNIDLVNKAKSIRYNSRFKEEGTNVNFLSEIDGRLAIRTYERGVEDETLSCGTGTVACAIVANSEWSLPSPINIATMGGNLNVSFEQEKGYSNIWLTGAAEFVFKGDINV